MRTITTVAFVLLATTSITDSASADPYKWCVEYPGRGATNCYFVTLQQCQAAASGNGGLCRPNGFYDGLPVTTPEEPARRSRKRS